MARTRQPQGAARIDPFFAIGLAELSYQRTSLLDGSAWTSFGTAPTYDAGPHGLRVNSTAAFGGLYRTPRINCATAEQTHLFVGEVGTSTGAYAGLIGSARGDGGAGSLSIQRNAANNGWSVYPNSSYSDMTPDLITGVGLVSLVMSSFGGSTAVFVNGVPWRLDALAATAQTTCRLLTFGERSASASYATKGVCYLRGAWARGMSQTVAQELSRNPWQLFAPSRRVWVQLGAAAGGVASDGVGAAAGSGTAGGVGASLFYGVASAAGVGAATGVGAAQFAGVGGAAGVGAATGVGSSISSGSAVGSAAGVGAATGVGASIYAGIGSAAGIAVAGGIGAYLATLSGVGFAAGVGAASAVGSYAGASIWTDVGVSAATWSDVGGASSIWTDL
jgi:hypothetical protein